MVICKNGIGIGLSIWWGSIGVKECYKVGPALKCLLPIPWLASSNLPCHPTQSIEWRTQEWLNCNKLLLNVIKTHCMISTPRKKIIEAIKVRLYGVNIQRVFVTKFHGVQPGNITLTHWGRDKNGRHFPGDIFKCIFLNENIWISIKISLKFVYQGPIKNISALVQIMAWRRPGGKPISEPMMVNLPTHICVTRPQWVKYTSKKLSKCVGILCKARTKTWLNHLQSTCTINLPILIWYVVIIYRARVIPPALTNYI